MQFPHREPNTVWVFCDEDISRADATFLRTRRGIARSFQTPAAVPKQTVRAESHGGAGISPRPMEAHCHRRATPVDTMMLNPDLGWVLYSRPKCLHDVSFSQVELRKMELARAMATHPRLLISDEAMAGLVEFREQDDSNVYSTT